MFKEPFNFAFQRTPLQALGWYLAMLLFAALLGGIIGASLPRIPLLELDVMVTDEPGHKPCTVDATFEDAAC